MPKRAGAKHRANLRNRRLRPDRLPPVEARAQPAPKAPAGETDSPSAEASGASSDVREGKTLFVRNLSFASEEEDLADLVSRFGPLEYCLICRDKDTGQSRGSAFVKFADAASAEACLAAESELLLDSRPLKLDYALERTQVQQKTAAKSHKERDKRNLYLQHEGWIRAGTPAAEGVSTTDLQKRAALAEKKKSLLRLLTNFVSKTRLCVHNLPPEMEDKQLRRLFQEATRAEAVITECRVMRNRAANGQLTGFKGFAFVEFVDHQDALTALRKLNNNPSVFSQAKRPIVEFAIENMFALKKKQRRAELSAQHSSSTDTQSAQQEAKTSVTALAKKIGVTPRSLDRTLKLKSKKKVKSQKSKKSKRK